MSRSVSASRQSISSFGNAVTNNNGTGHVRVLPIALNAFTASAQYTWKFKAMFAGQNSVQTIQKKQSGPTGFQIYASASAIHFQERTGSTATAFRWNYQLNRPYSLICTYDGTAQQIKFYVDGVQLTNQVLSITWANVTSTSAGDLMFGGSGGGGEGLNGILDEATWYDAVLSADDVFITSRDQAVSTPIALRYQFSEGSGSSVAPSVGTGTGTIINSSLTWTTSPFSLTRTAIA